MYDTGRKCKIEGCQDVILRWGMCRPHYNSTKNNKMKSKGCKTDGCSLVHYSHGFCRKHHRAIYKEKCEVEGCAEGEKVAGLCPMHYNRMARTGEVGPAGRLQKERDGI